MIRRGVALLALTAAACSSAHATADNSAARAWLAANALSLRLMHAHAVALALVVGDAPQVAQQAPGTMIAVTDVMSHLPTPDLTLSRLTFNAAAEYRQAVYDAQNPGGPTTAVQDLRQGDASFAQAVTRSQELGRSIYAP